MWIGFVPSGHLNPGCPGGYFLREARIRRGDSRENKNITKKSRVDLYRVRSGGQKVKVGQKSTGDGEFCIIYGNNQALC